MPYAASLFILFLIISAGRHSQPADCVVPNTQCRIRLSMTSDLSGAKLKIAESVFSSNIEKAQARQSKTQEHSQVAR